MSKLYPRYSKPINLNPRSFHMSRELHVQISFKLTNSHFLKLMHACYVILYVTTLYRVNDASKTKFIKQNLKMVYYKFKQTSNI